MLTLTCFADGLYIYISVCVCVYACICVCVCVCVINFSHKTIRTHLGTIHSIFQMSGRTVSGMFLLVDMIPVRMFSDTN